ncbi:MAG: protein kinase domain-containing protein, partial [Acidimicrobiales bacterium]
ITEGVLADTIYIVTELCDGTLREEPGWGTSEPGFQAQLGAAVSGVSAGLAYLHGRGYIHRDVKAANILRAGNRWLVSDFGLVRDTSQPARRRRWQGTAPYLAPEAVSMSAGAPADIYAFGVVIHEALTGQWPYAPVVEDYDRPPLASGAAISISADLPSPWRGLVERCLSRGPLLRPTAAEIAPLLPDLHAAATVAPVVSPGSSTVSVDTLPPRSRISWGLLFLGACALVGVIVAAVWLLTNDWDDSDDSEAVSAPAPGSATGPTQDSRGRLVITSDLTLDADVTAGIVVAANDVRLDCDGHAIAGDGTSDRAGIEIKQGTVAVTVANCVVSGFPVGIDLNGDSATVESNYLNGNDYGLGAGSFNNTIRNNAAENNQYDAFTIQGPGSNLIEGNTMDGNENGLVVESQSTGNLFRDNTATRNSAGFLVGDETVGNAFENNTATGNIEGFADYTRSGEGDAGTGNSYDGNACSGNATDSRPEGLCG